MLLKSVIVLPGFATSTHVFSEVIGTSVKALKKMSALEVVASSSLMHCRSQNAEKKIRAFNIHSIHVTTWITTMKIKVKCKLTNHIYRQNIVSFLSPYCHKVSTKLAHNIGPSTAHH